MKKWESTLSTAFAGNKIASLLEDWSKQMAESITFTIWVIIIISIKKTTFSAIFSKQRDEREI